MKEYIKAAMEYKEKFGRFSYSYLMRKFGLTYTVSNDIIAKLKKQI